MTDCGGFSENYAAQINGVLDPSADTVPTMVLFADSDCNGLTYPLPVSGNLPSNQYTTTQTIYLAQYNLIPRSVYIPFNFVSVSMTSRSGTYQSTFLGPVLLPDLTLVRWQTPFGGGNNPNMFDDYIASITFNSIQSWVPTNVLNMCFGETRYIDVYPLIRYYPQSDRCDTFMTTQYCNQTSNSTSDVCSCIAEQPALEAQSKTLGVTLPVVCFGKKCATTASYKTNNMLSQPCNLTICQQIISSTPGIVNEGQDTIFCGGRFYESNGNLVQPSISILPAPSTSSESTPFYVWIMLGVSAVLFAILVILLFSDKPKKDTTVLQQIQKMQKLKQLNS